MKISTTESIHVAYSIWDLTDSYNSIAGVALVSLLENTDEHIIIHLLYDVLYINKSVLSLVFPKIMW